MPVWECPQAQELIIDITTDQHYVLDPNGEMVPVSLDEMLKILLNATLPDGTTPGMTPWAELDAAFNSTTIA